MSRCKYGRTSPDVQGVHRMKAKHICVFTCLILLACLLSACNIGTPIDTEDILNQETPSATITYSSSSTQRFIATLVLPTQTLTPHPITIGKNELMVVVSAVEKYYDEHGSYPNSINDLIPGYIAQLPYTSDGFEIWYKLSETQVYRVGFDPSER